MSKLLRTLAGASIVLITCLTVASCSNSTTASNYALRSLHWQNAHSGASKLFAPSKISEALPSRSYLIPGGKAIHVSSLVLDGEFSSWRRGKAVFWQQSGAETSTDWDSPDAQMRTAVVTVRVNSVLSAADGVSAPSSNSTVDIQVYVDRSRDVEKVAAGLVELKRAAIFLSQVPASTGASWIPAEYGSLILPIDAEGKLSTGLDAGESDEPTVAFDLTTIKRLEAAGGVEKVVNLTS